MYRIPSELDLKGIVGEFTTQLRVGQFDLQFMFGGVEFKVESEINLFRTGKLIGSWKPGAWPSPGFYEIMNSNVISWSIPNDRTLVIKLDNELEIHMVENSDQYECIQIQIEGEQWIF